MCPSDRSYGDAMASTEETTKTVTRYANAWLEDDLDGILGCYSDDFTIHYFGNNPFAGAHVGRDAALTALLNVGARAPRKLLAVDEILAGQATAVLVVREELQVDGDPIEIRRVLRFRVEEDQLVECWLYDEDQAMIDRAWSDPPPDDQMAV